MNIDFSLSIGDWLAYFEQLFNLIKNFFAKLGIQLFAEEETTVVPEEETTSV